MKILRFEDIIAWQKGQNFAVKIYSHFKGSKDFGFKDQIQRASISISNNIAEGFERHTDKDFIKFLYFSLASTSEAKSMLYLAHRLNYLQKELTDGLINDCNEICRILRSLIKSIN